jgi:AcrR family transcriptional regulator
MSNNTPSGLRARKKLESRAAILEATSRLIEQHGYDATTMRDIAEAAGVSHQTLYNYFPTKALIVHGMLTGEQERFVARINRLLDDESMDLLAILDGVVKLRLEVMGRDHRPLWREVVSLLFREENEFFGLLSQNYDLAQARLSTFFARAQKRGALSGDVEVGVLAQAVYAIVNFAMLQFIAEPNTTRTAIRSRVGAQLRLLLAPHLQPTHPGGISTGAATGSMQRGP